MIAHISIGVRDIDSSKRFYDAVLEPLGYKCLRAARSLVGYGYGATASRFGLSRPSTRFQPTKSRVCPSASQRRMLPPSMRFMRRHWPQADGITVHPVYVLSTAPTTKPPPSSVQT